MRLNKSNIKRYFKAMFKGLNVLTPDLLDYGSQDDLIYEITEGTDYLNRKILGITFLQLTDQGPKYRHDLGKCFTEKNADLRYINEYLKDLN